MATEINCPDCDAKLTIPDELLGSKVKCKKCEARFRTDVPDASPSVIDDHPPRRRRENDRIAKETDTDDQSLFRNTKSARPQRDNDSSIGRRASNRQRRSSNGKRKKSNVMAIVLILILTFVLFGSAGGGIAYYFGAFDSNDGRSTSSKNFNSKQSGQSGQEAVVEEISIEAVTLMGEDAANAFAIKYRWKNGVPQGEYFVCKGTPGGNQRSIPFEFEGKTEGTEIYEEGSSKGKKEFDVWIAKRRPGAMPGASSLLRVSNIIHIVVKS